MDNPPTPTPPAEPRPTKILVLDIGGSKVKALASGQTEPRKAPSGRAFTPERLVEVVGELAEGWEHQAISIGYPGVVGDHGPRAEPGNLGPGWVGFDYPSAFGRPVRIINDAAMQALGSYEGGRMLFLGLGTGLGSALIAEKVIVPLELGRLRLDDGATLGELAGDGGLDRLGKRAWRLVVEQMATTLRDAFQADDVVIGGGNAKKLKATPSGMRLGHNRTAFRGGFRLWGLEDVPTLTPGDRPPHPAPPPADWRLI
jgi:polyphosphate glucokinase